MSSMRYRAVPALLLPLAAWAQQAQGPSSAMPARQVPAPPSLQHLIQEAPGLSLPSAAAPTVDSSHAALLPRSAPAAGASACTATRILPARRGADAVAPARPAAPREEDRLEPAVECIVVEDDVARIEELRVRGQAQRIVVRPKDGSAPYEIQLLDAGRDPMAKTGPGRGGTGQRVWPVLSF